MTKRPNGLSPRDSTLKARTQSKRASARKQTNTPTHSHTIAITHTHTRTHKNPQKNRKAHNRNHNLKYTNYHSNCWTEIELQSHRFVLIRRLSRIFLLPIVSTPSSLHLSSPSSRSSDAIRSRIRPQIPHLGSRRFG